MKRVAYLTLGCDKNTVDTERALGSLRTAGYVITDEVEGAWALVVNTCCFIESAREESVEYIMEAVRGKERGSFQVLAVVGCLVERYREELVKEIPEVDLFMGLEHVTGLRDALQKIREEHEGPWPDEDDEETMPADLGVEICAWPHPRFLTTANHYAFLKIAEGCDATCRFCIIPRIRGRLNSEPLVEAVREAQALEAAGVKELYLVAQDTTAYGHDFDPPLELADLIERLLVETGIPWIRILYAHPERVTDRLIDLLANEKRLLRYLDLPLQHISDTILEKMGRKPGREGIEALLDKLYARVPDPVLRTSFLLGFPGEGEAEFKELIEFIEEGRFFWVSGFAYSPEEGTPAERLPGQVPPEIADDRLGAVFEAQRPVTEERLSRYVGRELTLIVDEPWSPIIADEPGCDLHDETGTEWTARFSGQAIEVDGVTRLLGQARPGDLVRAKVIKSWDYDLVAKMG